MNSPEKESKDVRVDYERKVGSLRLKVRKACAHAKLETGTELVGEHMATGKLYAALQDQDLLEFDWDNSPHAVFVPSSHEYLTLLDLSLQELARVNFQLSEADLKDYRRMYNFWFMENIDYAMEHELQHQFGVVEFTKLQYRLGVLFVKDNNGVYNYFPNIDLKGIVPWGIYRDAVLSAPRELSPGDKLDLGLSLDQAPHQA